MCIFSVFYSIGQVGCLLWTGGFFMIVFLRISLMYTGIGMSRCCSSYIHSREMS